MEWTIAEVAEAAGTTSRTLRHYGAIGLLEPSSTAVGGMRRYDEAGLIRLQRILLLRELGLGLEAIRRVLDGGLDEATALATHLELLEEQRGRLDRQIAAVRSTIRRRERGEELVAPEMFDGFDHTQYREEVEQRWGRAAYRRSDQWWRSLTAAEKADFRREQQQIIDAFAEAYREGTDPAAEQVQETTARLYRWLQQSAGEVSKEYFTGLGQLYVDDPRFAAVYGGPDGATYVRDAMHTYATTTL